jgi:hypothetical protein
MKEFVDNSGTRWNVELTIASIKRVRDLLSVNLLEPESGEPPLLTRLGSDVILLCDVIYVLVKPQADSKGVTDEAFGALLGGDAILSAQEAFYRELIDFFLKSGRPDKLKMIEKQRALLIAAIKTAATKVEAIDTDAICSKSFTNLPESPASSPTA